jgi:hypothetical protein
VSFALELPQVLDHDGARRHVDPERQRLGREHELDEPLLEQLLDGLLEHRQHPGVVRRDAGGERVDEVVEPERDEVVVIHPGRAHLRELPDPVGLVRLGQPDARLHHPRDAPVAAGAAEHEVDRGEQALVGEDLDDLLTPWDVHAAVPLARTGSALMLQAPAPPADVRPVPHLLAVERHDVRVGDGLAALVDVHRVQVVPDQVVVLERDRALLLDHDPRRAAERPDPLAELLRV